MSLADAEQSWNQLRMSLHEVYKRNASKLYFEVLYRSAYNLVLNKQGNLLFTGVTKKFEEQVEDAFLVIEACSNDTILSVVVKHWEDHKLTTSLFGDILMYLDRAYCSVQEKMTVRELGYEAFRNKIVLHPRLRPRLTAVLLRAVQQDRRGLPVDRAELKGALAMLSDLNHKQTRVYEAEFEAPFLRETAEFYRHEAAEFLAQNTVPDFVYKMTDRLEEEARRVAGNTREGYLSRSSEGPLMAVLHQELVAAHAVALVEMQSSGCEYMIRERRYDELQALHQLLLRGGPDHVQLLRECAARYMKTSGLEIVSDPETAKDPLLFVQQLLGLRAAADTVLHQCFGGDLKCARMLKDSFDLCMNSDPRAASSLACFVDSLLRNGAKADDAEVELQLEKSVVLFRHLQDKDVYENYHKNALSRRLLSGKSSSLELEKLVISKLKAECGMHYTGKMEGMLTDMQVSKIESDEFTQASSCSSLSGAAAASLCELDVVVITQSYWPSAAPVRLQLPPPLAACHDAFTSFYVHKHPKRKLLWQLGLGSVDVRHCRAKVLLSVSSFQSAILLLFNSAAGRGGGGGLQLQQILKLTGGGVSESEMKRQLLSLATPKYMILKKSTKSKGVSLDDEFSVNEDFSSKLRKIKVPLVQLRDLGLPGDGGAADSRMMMSAAVPAEVEEERRHFTEACVVRIMKTRKSLSHNDLVSEALKQTAARFPADAAFVKKRIESLIERDYLERHPSNRSMYQYVA